MDGKLVLSGLTRSYGATPVVDRLALALAPGEFVALLGPSGCGKTTTLRMIAGFVPPSAGTITLDRRVLSSAAGVVPPHRRGMSMIFQSYAIWPHMTVFENVAFGLRARRVAAAELRTRVAEVLDVVQLGALAARYPGELSGGQQQRVALARSVVVKPEVLLLDEPLSNLDTSLREEMRREIRRIHDAFGMTTVYVTHDLAEAMSTSDRIAVMAKGRIEQIDAPATIFRRPRTRFVANFIGRTNLVDAARDGDVIRFPGFAVPAARLATTLAQGAAGVFALRAQAVRVHAAQPADAAGIVVAGRITDRTYLGDTWDYSFESGDGAASLRMAAAPSTELAVGSAAWIEIDPAHLLQVEAG